MRLLVMQKVKDRRALASKYIRDPAYKKQVRLQPLRLWLKLPIPPHALAQPHRCRSSICLQHVPGTFSCLPTAPAQYLKNASLALAEVAQVGAVGRQQSNMSGAKLELWPGFEAQNSKRAHHRLCHCSAG